MSAHAEAIFDTECASDLLGVTRDTIRKMAADGRLASCGADVKGYPLFKWEAFAGSEAVRDMDADLWKLQSLIRPMRRYTSVELFAGGGGLALGLEQAGFEHVLLNEFMPEACNTLRRNRPGWNILEGDVSQVDFTPWRGKVDLVSGGFPCQAFSYAGHRMGFDDARGTLFFQWARAIKEIQPPMFLGENVRGLLTHDGGRTMETIKNVIAELGYTLVPPQVLKAVNYAVPQKRERLVLVGVRNDLAANFKFNWPAKAPRIYTVRDALKKGELFDCDVPASDGQKYPPRKAQVLSMVPPGGYWRDLPPDVQREYMKGSFHLEGGKTGMARRLSWDAPSLTLTCAPAQNQTERCHPAESRPLAVREYARIQTFPDDWQFAGSLAMQYKQIGNAVPVNLAKAVGLRLVEALNAIEVSCLDARRKAS